MNEEEERKQLWKVYYIVLGVMIGGSILILGGQAVWNGIQQNLSPSAIQTNPPSSTPSNPSTDTSPSSVNQENLSNPFEQVAFPFPSCGDSLPTDPNAYPVNFYPVFINYTESNLQTVKSNFCGDAYKIIRKNTDQISIQVGSFVTLERAKYFQSFMSNKFGNAEIGEPRQIQTIPR
ncbi:MAG: hypothetical protein WBV73_27060 [Phormidium sp.]